MSFLWGASGLRLRDRGRNLDIRGRLGGEMLLLCIKSSQLGAPVVEWLRAHAAYAAELGLNPGRRSFTECHSPSLSHDFLSIYFQFFLNVSVPEKKPGSQSRWFGHLVKMLPGRLPLEVYQARPTGRRPRCRPWTLSRDYIFPLALRSTRRSRWVLFGKRKSGFHWSA